MAFAGLSYTVWRRMIKPSDSKHRVVAPLY